METEQLTDRVHAMETVQAAHAAAMAGAEATQAGTEATTAAMTTRTMTTMAAGSISVNVDFLPGAPKVTAANTARRLTDRGFPAVGNPRVALTVLGRFVRPLAEAIRWAEPWDWEHDDDPLLDRDQRTRRHAVQPLELSSPGTTRS